MYYCDCKTIKKRNLSSESVNGDSVIYSSPFEIENFFIENGNLLVTEIDSSYEKVNIKYYVDGVCSFCESVLFRLKKRELNPVKSVKFSEKNTYTVIINPKEEYFVLDY